MKRLCLILAVLVVPATPAAAKAADVAMRVETVVPHGRVLQAAPSMRFNMLALSGRGTVAFRTHRIHGGWSAWQAADDDVAWTGGSDAFQVRSAHAVRAYEIWSRVTTAPSRRPAAAGGPAIVTRAEWGANEEIVRGEPIYASAVKLSIVHHTVSTNTYSRAQAAAIVRGIEVFHVEGNGWNDIGYNFLVDRFGTVYEGRAGGIDRNVVGAHAEGFNTGTVGVSLVGNFQAAALPKAMQDALVQLLAWRLDVAHVDPLSTVVYTSGGNAKYRPGKVVTLRAVSGHRDTGPTECPGNAAYALLPAVTKRVAATGLPKLYAPTVVGVLGGPVRFGARLSRRLAWTVTVVDAFGRVAAAGAGTGATVDWTWSSPAAAKGLYTWTIAAPGIRVATGTIGVGRPVPPAALSLTGLAVVPAVLTPAADGTMTRATVTFTLGAAATVTVRVVDAVSGATALTLAAGARAAGADALAWDPGPRLPDGRYQVVVTARAGGKSVTRVADVVVDRTVAGFSATPAVFSPNHDLMLDTTTFGFLLAAPAAVRLDIESAGSVVASPFAGALPAGAQTITWDGSAFGPPLYDGAYTAILTVTDALGDVPVATPVRIDTAPPHLRLVSRAPLALAVDEPATVAVVVNSKTTLTLSAPGGTFRVPFVGAVTSFTAEATDIAGNVSALLSG